MNGILSGVAQNGSIARQIAFHGRPDSGSGQPDVPQIAVAHRPKLVGHGLLETPGDVGRAPSAQNGGQPPSAGVPGLHSCRCQLTGNAAHGHLRQMPCLRCFIGRPNQSTCEQDRWRGVVPCGNAGAISHNPGRGKIRQKYCGGLALKSAANAYLAENTPQRRTQKYARRGLEGPVLMYWVGVRRFSRRLDKRLGAARNPLRVPHPELLEVAPLQDDRGAALAGFKGQQEGTPD